MFDSHSANNSQFGDHDSSGVKASVPGLPPEMASRLIDALCHDDALRSVFRECPRDALAQLGYGPAADPAVSNGIWKCLHGARLPSKEYLNEIRESLHVQLVGTGNHSVFNLG